MGKLGLHVQAWTPGTLDAALRTGGAALKVMAPDLEPIQKVYEKFPDTMFILRRYADKEEEHGLIMDRGFGGWKWMDRLGAQFSDIIRWAHPRAVKLYVEGPNEPPTFPNYQYWAQAQNDFSLGFIQAAKSYGNLRPVVFNYSVGNPPGTEDEMRYIWAHLTEAIDAVIEAGGLVGLHEYSAPTMRHDETWHCLRYRRVLPMLSPAHQAAIRILIGECGIDGGVLKPPPPIEKAGWKSFASAEEYRDQLAWYDAEISKDPQVVAATIFTAGSTGWHDFDVTHCDPVLDYIAANRPDRRPPPPPPPPVYEARQLSGVQVGEGMTQLNALWGWQEKCEESGLGGVAEGIRKATVALKRLLLGVDDA